MATGDPTISLERFAGVRAALAEKLPLAEILEQEQIEEAAFHASEPIWTERIADSVATQLEYTEKLRIAEDTLARSLRPIADDEAAWVGLLGALANATDQAALLAKLGITLTDVGRVGRLWKRRIQSDPELGPRLAKLAETPTPPEKVTAGPIELRPFPWSPKTKRAPAPAPAAVKRDDGADGVPQAEAAPKVERALASFQKVDVAGPAATPAHESSFSGWTIAHYAALARGLRANPAEAEAVMQRSGLLTPESRRLVHEHFQRRFQSEPGLRATFDALLTPTVETPAPAKPSRSDPLGGTDEMDVAQIRRAALPFQKSTAPRENAGAPPSEPRRKPRKTMGGAVSKHTPEDEAVISRMKAAYARTPDPFAGTAQMDVVKPVSPEESLPFLARPPASSPPAASAPKAQSGKTITTSAPLDWTLDQYARLSAELLASGLPEARVLASARVSVAAKQLLDTYWQALLRDDATLRAEWQSLTHKYIAEFRGR